MSNLLKALLKHPWLIPLLLGVALVALPFLTIDKDHWISTHVQTSLLPFWVGIGLIVLSCLVLLLQRKVLTDDAGAGLDLSRVKEDKGALWTKVSGCEIRVVNGRIEDSAQTEGVAVVLPCNEYFDDACASDPRSALGAYVNRVFEGQVAEFMSLTKGECKKQLGPGVENQKTHDERAESFGAGRCVLLTRPLNRKVPIALVSTTTQTAGQGLASRISYLFDAMHELVTRLADARLNDVAMPILGAGHGGIYAPLAFVGLLLAVAEAARYGQSGQRLKRVTIVVFKKDASSPAEVDQVVVRRALALVGQKTD